MHMQIVNQSYMQIVNQLYMAGYSRVCARFSLCLCARVCVCVRLTAVKAVVGKILQKSSPLLPTSHCDTN